MINDPEAEAIFRQEADALTESLQSGLLSLKAAPEDAAVVAQVFRDLHTLKGTGAMFGFGRMAEFIHDFETAFEAVRDGRATVDGDLIRVSLRAHDIIIDMLAGVDPDPVVEADVLAALHRVQDPTGAPTRRRRSRASRMTRTRTMTVTWSMAAKATTAFRPATMPSRSMAAQATTR